LKSGILLAEFRKKHTHTQPNNKRKPKKSKIEIQSNSDLQSNSGIPAQPRKQKHPTKQNKSRAQIFNLQGKFSRSVPAAADPLLFSHKSPLQK
jgi:hypothetical protein